MNIATYTSVEYFSTFLTFYKTIEDKKTSLYILCLDKEVELLIKKFNVKCKFFHLHEIDNDFPKLRSRKFKNINEKIGVYRLFYSYKLINDFNLSIHLIDSDTFFFTSPIKLNEYINSLGASVAYAEHNYSYKKNKMSDKYGVYNAGYIFFKNNETARNFLQKYKSKCYDFITWEISQNKKNIFADQTYLEDLKNISNEIKIIKHKGINCAPWNIGNYKVKIVDETIFVDNDILIFYHFSGIRYIFNNIFLFNLFYYNQKNLSNVKNIIYQKYLKLLKKNILLVKLNKKNYKTFNIKKFFLFFKKIFNKDFMII